MKNNFEDIANLITIRSFLVTSIDNLHIKLSRDDIKNIQARIQYLDKTILDHSLKMDLSKIGQESHNNTVREFYVESTENTKDVFMKHKAPVRDTADKHMVGTINEDSSTGKSEE